MSGGYFDYKQYYLDDIASKIEKAMQNENSENIDEWGYHTSNGFSKETMNEFKTAIRLVKLAEIYTQRIDWLLCGDDGEDSFHERLAEDMDKLAHDGEI